MSNKVKPPVWYWIVSVIAVLWNAMGAFNYLIQRLQPEEFMASQPEELRGMIESQPSWAVSGFAIAVWAGLLASVMLLMRKAAAQVLFILSLMGVFVQNTYWMFLSGMTLSFPQLILPITIIFFGLAMIVLSRGAKNRGWIG